MKKLKRKIGRGGKSGKRGTQSTETVAELKARAEEEIMQCRSEEAAALLKRALALNPFDTPAMDMLARCFMDLSDVMETHALLCWRFIFRVVAFLGKWFFAPPHPPPLNMLSPH